MLKLLVVWHVAGLNGGIGNLDFERQAEGVGDFRHAHGREGTGQRAGEAGMVQGTQADVAQALVPAVSRLVSTPVRGGDIVSKAGVGMSADAAGMSACATSHRNTCEKRRLSMPQAVEVCYGKLPSDDCALGLNAGVGSHGSHLRFERESAAADGAESNGLLHGHPAKTPRCPEFSGTG
jgi:hypothetical protein